MKNGFVPNLGGQMWIVSVCLASALGCVLVNAGKASSILVAGVVALFTVPVAAKQIFGRLRAGDPLFLYMPIMLVFIVLRVLSDDGAEGAQFVAAIGLIGAVLLSGRAKRALSKQPSIFISMVMLAVVLAILAWYVLFPQLRQKNAVGAAVFYVLLLPGLLLFRKRTPLAAYLLGCTAFVVIAFDMRSIIIVTAIILFALFSPFGRSPWACFLATLVLTIGTVIVVSQMRSGVFDQYLSAYSSHFDRGLESGRDVIWPMALEQASASPYFGSGFASGQFYFRDGEISAHNQYLEILVQQGWVGLGLCVVLFLLITRKASAQIRGAFERQRFSGLFCGILYANAFEVQLFQNLFYIGIVQWAIIALALYSEASHALASVATSSDLATSSSKPGSSVRRGLVIPGEA